MKDSARYAKIVEWSEEDHCFVGSTPGLIYGGCHGQDEREVFDQLCQVVEEAIELYKEDGKPLPPPTATGVPLSDAHRTAIEERLAEHQRDPDDVISRDEVLAAARRG